MTLGPLDFYRDLGRRADKLVFALFCFVVVSSVLSTIDVAMDLDHIEKSREITIDATLAYGVGSLMAFINSAFYFLPFVFGASFVISYQLIGAAKVRKRKFSRFWGFLYKRFWLLVFQILVFKYCGELSYFVENKRFLTRLYMFKSSSSMEDVYVGGNRGQDEEELRDEPFLKREDFLVGRTCT